MKTGVTNLGGLIGTYDTVESTDPNSEKVMKNTLAIKKEKQLVRSLRQLPQAEAKQTLLMAA